MRVPYAVLSALRSAIEAFPDLRMGQLIQNALKDGDDLFYLKDETLAQRLLDYTNTHNSKCLATNTERKP